LGSLESIGEVGVDCATALGDVVDAVTGADSPPGPEPAAGLVWVAALASAGSSSGLMDRGGELAARPGWVGGSVGGDVADVGVVGVGDGDGDLGLGGFASADSGLAIVDILSLDASMAGYSGCFPGLRDGLTGKGGSWLGVGRSSERLGGEM
jgi:hypothetical protein